MQQLLLDILHALESEDVRYCLLRDGHHLDRFAEGGEVDVLIDEGKAERLREVLTRFGFVHLPAWGRRPHHFFVGYHEPSGRWLKFDAVTQLAYGSPTHEMVTSLAEECLRRRRRLGRVFLPAPEDELITLLLHCVLDKICFAPLRRQRLRALRHQITDPAYLSKRLASCWPSQLKWPDIAGLIDSDDWATLLAERGRVAARLTRRDRLAVLGRRIRDRALRKCGRVSGISQPKAPLVAFLAPDGAGKSTLIAAIRKSFYFSTRAIYMGYYPNRNRPGFRPAVPGLSTAGRLLAAWWRYLAARCHQARGRLVLFDRYTYDAMLPPAEKIGRLRRWRRHLLARACPAPDLIVMLDAPGSLLFARKGEHSPAVLERQRQGYLAFRDRLPQMVVVDATGSLDGVCRKVTSLIWRKYPHMLERSRS